MSEHVVERDVPLAERSLSALDRILHWSLDWYITRTLPGWGHLQVWQYRVCCAYEHRYDQRVTPPEVCSTCGGSFDSPPCSLNREIGWSGHTIEGGAAQGGSDS